MENRVNWDKTWEDWNKDDVIIDDTVKDVLPEVMEVFDLHIKMVEEGKANGMDRECQDIMTMAVLDKLCEVVEKHNMTVAGFTEEVNYQFQRGRFRRFNPCTPKPILDPAREYVDRNQGNLIDDPDYYKNRPGYWPRPNMGTPPLMKAPAPVEEVEVVEEPKKKVSMKDVVRFFLGLA